MPRKTKDTPAMGQYLSIRTQYKGVFLFYRLGDFYELFYEDTISAAQILESTLISRNRNADNLVPMCSVPYHATQGYTDTSVEQGYKVAVCEQVENLKTTEGMVKRGAVQLVTSGAVTNSRGLEAEDSNYLTAVLTDGNQFSFIYVDLSTGKLKAAVLADEEGILNEVSASQTKEMVSGSEIPESLKENLGSRLNITFSTQEMVEKGTEFSFLANGLINSLEIEITGKLLSYLFVIQKRGLSHIQKAAEYQPDHFLRMDHYSKFNLGLSQSIRTGQRKGIPLWLLGETKAVMGGRLLKQWLDRPLIQERQIKVR